MRGRSKALPFVLTALLAASCADVVDPGVDGPGPATGTPQATHGTSPREIPLSPGASGLLVAENAVWVAVPDAVVRIDPDSGDVLGEMEIEGISRDSTFTIGGESIWVTAASPKYAGRTPDVVRLDPATGAVTDRVSLSSELSAILFSDGYLVYGSAGEGIGTIVRYDPETGDFRDSKRRRWRRGTFSDRGNGRCVLGSRKRPHGWVESHSDRLLRREGNLRDRVGRVFGRGGRIPVGSGRRAV